jgi:hypothetical protein
MELASRIRKSTIVSDRLVKCVFCRDPIAFYRRDAECGRVQTVRLRDRGIRLAHRLRSRTKHWANPRQLAGRVQAMNDGQARRVETASAASEASATPLDLMRTRRRLDPNAPAVENIARVIGAGATARLISTFGGGRVYIARNPGRSDAVARVIGAEAAAMLGAIFGGERIWFPNDAGHFTRRRIVQMRRRGSSISRIARALRLSERYVYKVLAELRDD